MLLLFITIICHWDLFQVLSCLHISVYIPSHCRSSSIIEIYKRIEIFFMNTKFVSMITNDPSPILTTLPSNFIFPLWNILLPASGRSNMVFYICWQMLPSKEHQYICAFLITLQFIQMIWHVIGDSFNSSIAVPRVSNSRSNFNIQIQNWSYKIKTHNHSFE